MIFLVILGSFLLSISINAMYRDILSSPEIAQKIDKLNTEISMSLCCQDRLLEEFEIVCRYPANDESSNQGFTDIKKLLQNGLKARAKTKNGQPLVSLLLDSTLMHNQIIEILSLLIEKGASVNIENNEGDSPLLQICSKDYPHQWQQTDLAQFLLNKGADVNFQSKNGNTPLHAAVRSSNVGLFKVLWSQKPKLKMNVQDIDPRSLAALKQQVKILQIIDGTYLSVENDRSNNYYV